MFRFANYDVPTVQTVSASIWKDKAIRQVAVSFSPTQWIALTTTIDACDYWRWNRHHDKIADVGLVKKA